MTTKQSDITDRIISCAQRAFSLEKGVIGPDTKRADLTAWDSLGHLKLLLLIEDEFGIKFTLTETADLSSIRSFATAVKAKTEHE